MEKSSGERVVRGMLCVSTWRGEEWSDDDSRGIYAVGDEVKRKENES